MLRLNLPRLTEDLRNRLNGWRVAYVNIEEARTIGTFDPPCAYIKLTNCLGYVDVVADGEVFLDNENWQMPLKSFKKQKHAAAWLVTRLAKGNQ